jgi:serine/threonine protein kinase
VPTFAEIAAEVPQALGDVIMRCLSRDPSARYASARGLLEALEKCESDPVWTWREAEEWWRIHAPRAAAPVDTVDTGTYDLLETLADNRDGRRIEPEKTVLNHELPPQLYDEASAVVNA